MDTINVWLHLTDEIKDGIKSGLYYRDGGVIRDTDNAQIVALLRDADIVENQDLPGFGPLTDSLSVLPQAVMAYQMCHIAEKLENIEALINQLRNDIGEVKRRVEAVHIKLDSKVFGEMVGSIMNCQIAIIEAQTSRLPGYRADLVKKVCELKMVVSKMIESLDHVKFYPEEVQLYSRAFLMAKTAIRDISLIMGEEETARQFSSELVSEAEQLKVMLQMRLDKPSSLFWIKDIHRSLLNEQKDNIRRLEDHQEQIPVLVRPNRTDAWKNLVYENV